MSGAGFGLHLCIHTHFTWPDVHTHLALHVHLMVSLENPELFSFSMGSEKLREEGGRKNRVSPGFCPQRQLMKMSLSPGASTCSIPPYAALIFSLKLSLVCLVRRKGRQEIAGHEGQIEDLLLSRLMSHAGDQCDVGQGCKKQGHRKNSGPGLNR